MNMAARELVQSYHAEIFRLAFSILYEELINGASTVNDPDTRKQEPIDRSEAWVYFDLDWGAVVPGQAVFHLQNGKTIGSPPSPAKTIDTGFLYYKELPSDLKEVYEKTVADLEARVSK